MSEYQKSCTRNRLLSVINVLLLCLLIFSENSTSATRPPPDNWLPTTFDLVFPLDKAFSQGAEHRIYDWKDSIDPDGGPVTYNFYLNGNLKASGITESYFHYTGGYGVSTRLPIEYHWQVEAVDDEGGITYSSEGYFTTHPPGLGDPSDKYIHNIIKGIVFSDLSHAAIAAAKVRASIPSVYFLESAPDGTFVGQIIFTYPFEVTPTPEEEVFELIVEAAGFKSTTLRLNGTSETYIDVDVPMPVDTDQDGIENKTDADDDSDGLSDIAETQTYNTDPLKKDTDGDGMDDKYEVDNQLDPNTHDTNSDKDGDGYTNLEEYEAGSVANDPSDIPRSGGAWGAVIPYILDQQ